MGVRRPLPQGPVLPCSAGFFSPPAPRSFGVNRAHLSASMSSAYGSIPMTFGPARAGPFFIGRRQADTRARMLAPSPSVACLLDRRERGAENRLRLFRRAALHQDSRFVDVSALERLHRDAPRI